MPAQLRVWRLDAKVWRSSGICSHALRHPGQARLSCRCGVFHVPLACAGSPRRLQFIRLPLFLHLGMLIQLFADELKQFALEFRLSVTSELPNSGGRRARQRLVHVVLVCRWRVPVKVTELAMIRPRPSVEFCVVPPYGAEWLV